MAANPSGGYLISERSRNKLNAFTYKSGRESTCLSSSPSESHAPIETYHGDVENRILRSTVDKGPWNTSYNGLSTQPEGSKAVKESPKTPANRIPLAALIGNAEDALNKTPKQDTPVEQVVWQHVPVSSSSDTSGESGNRGKKRQRSSSPSSSPSSQNPLLAKESFDLQSVAHLDTPQDYVAAELWGSYVGKTSVNGNGGSHLPTLPPCSPQTPASAKMRIASSDLRRSNSCNADFPNSHVKKRRIWGHASDSRRGTSTQEKGSMLNSSSKIKSLLEIIEGSMQKPPVRPVTGPSASSPSKNNSDAVNRSPSPAKTKKDLRDAENLVSKESSSDYGDDDAFDEEFLKLAEASMIAHEDRSTTRNDQEPSEMDVDLPLEPQQLDNMHACQPNFTASGIDMDKLIATDGIQECGQPPAEDVGTRKEGNAMSAPQKVSMAKDQQHSGELASRTDTSVPISDRERQPAGGFGEGSFDDEFDDDELDIEAIEQTMSMIQSGSDQVCRPQNVPWSL